MKSLLIAQTGSDDVSLADSFRSVSQKFKYDRIDVAVAYATLQGVKFLEKSLGKFPAASRWVVGLDDAITQPEAIQYLMSLGGSTTRLAALAPARRFHPKLYLLWSSTDPSRGAIAIGSGNMTQNGLRKNGETAVILEAESSNDVTAFKATWESMWTLGLDATIERVQTYTALYKAARKQRKIIADLGVAPQEPEPNAPPIAQVALNGDPKKATTAWTEGASPSAGGRDLELPKKMMPFFSLAGHTATKRFRMANGKVFPLTFTERLDNQMWRVLFSRESIVAGIGRESLRPLSGANRSDLAIVFRRSAGAVEFNLDLVVIGSADHKKLVSNSQSVGALMSTRNPGGRLFGFF